MKARSRGYIAARIYEKTPAVRCMAGVFSWWGRAVWHGASPYAAPRPVAEMSAMFSPRG
ncbi:hypothetical protein GXY_15892 [Novacetimonas hansenii ATCC 23769]|uniref:Uncharacterized protein n=1 Tax=Novacetimonas hansenii ATCC 23769 TaxID=714995 RepID=D5QJ45_NOVHA|nr:hypothetical protein GXY_15892 [Novacetimonas hansenii ATCC 23769]